MALHSLRSVQKIPAGPSVAWDFFSDPRNLERITPPSMRFVIRSALPSLTVYAGQEIEYRVSPILRIPLYWKTEIVQVDDGRRFIDEQREGPFALWRHIHEFDPVEGGVQMKDFVEYENPLGILGEWANGLFVRRKVLEIFRYRFRKVEEIFGAWPDGQEMKIEIK